MKRIAFALPVDYMCGSLSGRQDLNYGTGHSSAYDVPEDESVSANSYEPKLIAMRNHKTDRRYFMVRTKSTEHATQMRKIAMAALGGAGSMFAVIMNDNSLKERLTNYWRSSGGPQNKQTLRTYFFSIVVPALMGGDVRIEFEYEGEDVYFDNPWGCSNQGDVRVPTNIYNKFEEVLGGLV